MSETRRSVSRRVVLATVAVLYVGTAWWQTSKPLPPGTDVDSGETLMPAQGIEFLHDLTYTDGDGVRHEQEIFDAALRMIDEAHSVIVLDFFLFNDQAGSSRSNLRPLSRELANHLLARKRAVPAIHILLITDPINDVYGGAPSPLLKELAAAGIAVVTTDLARLRDSNPGYSSLWRIFVQWWGNSPAISWLPNPFAEGPSRISLRSWLALLNFKANHRKVLVADRADGSWAGLVTSGNPHDASSAHSNVALRIAGALPLEIFASELAVARFSGWSGELAARTAAVKDASPTVRAAFVTEQAIRDRLLATINSTTRQDAIAIAMFYLSDRKVIDALLAAAERGTRVRLILDPNKDAFGIEKDGVPNRPVARELVEASGGAIAIRWYRTQGEQFHTKFVLVAHPDRVTVSLGSANLTRRNLANYNLEANVQLEVPRSDALATELLDYFERLWTNRGGAGYTLPFEAYRDDSRLRYWRYRVMEATGLSTF